MNRPRKNLLNMLSKNDKNKLDHAVKLANAVRRVVDALNAAFVEWKGSSFVDKNIIKDMEKTHKMVVDYIYGLLGGKMHELINKKINGSES